MEVLDRRADERRRPMNEAHWDRLEATRAYAGRVKLTDYLVRLPSGELGHYEVDESIPFAVAVLIEQDDEILLTRQYRFPLNAWIFDLPGGAGEEGELPEIAARREVQEELGLSIDSMVALQHFFPNPGRSAWPVYLFLAKVAEEGLAALDDPWERVAGRRVKKSHVREMIAAGELVDPSLLIAWQSATAKGLLGI